MYDVVIAGGRLVDGTGNPWRWADVAIEDGRIAAIGRIGRERGRRVLDADGLVVAPGFIDLHAHSDFALFEHPEHHPKVGQGVTTDLIGQDGLSYAPISPDALPVMRELIAGINGDPPIAGDWQSVGEFLDRIEAARPAVNVAYLVPHAAVRLSVMGMAARTATDGELDAMARMAAEGMVDGAFGLSTGLTYPPAQWSDTREIVALARAIEPYGGIYVTHHRDYGAGLQESVREALRIGRESGVPVHFSHFHVSGRQWRGQAGRFLRLIDEARASGQDVTLDAYPYLAGSTFLGAFLPEWVQSESPATAIGILGDPEARERICREIDAAPRFTLPISWSDMVVAGVSTEANRSAEGRTVAELADAAGVSPGAWVCDLLVAERMHVNVLVFMGDEGNVREIMAHPVHTVGTDGILVGGSPHPRVYGTFPTLLGRYVRELGVLSLEEAVRHMTGAAASRLGLTDRGVLRPGARADLVAFDPAGIGSPATYANPTAPPVGLPYVLVNGTPVKWEDNLTDARPGAVLRRR